MVFLLLGAGSETTTHLISGSVYELTRAPTFRDWLEEDWSRANLAIEEFLRFVSPVQFRSSRTQSERSLARLAVDWAVSPICPPIHDGHH
jgi:cytochrome P450